MSAHVLFNLINSLIRLLDALICMTLVSWDRFCT